VSSSRRIFDVKRRVNSGNKLRFIARPWVQGELPTPRTLIESAPGIVMCSWHEVRVHEFMSFHLYARFIGKMTERIPSTNFGFISLY
jgi:hypothetical protein